MTLEEAILRDSRITNLICRLTRTSVAELTERRPNGKLARSQDIADVRHVIYFFYREFFPEVPLIHIPYKTLGIVQDHSTVINALTKVNNRVESERPFRVLIERLRVLVAKHWQTSTIIFPTSELTKKQHENSKRVVPMPTTRPER